MPIASRLPPLEPAAPPPRGAAAPAAPRPVEPAPTAATPKAKKSWLERVRGGVFGLTALGLALIVAGGVALRVTVKDGFAPLAPAFYALSVPVLVTLGVAAAVCTVMACGVRLTFKRLALGLSLALVAGLYAAVFLFQDATFDDRPRVMTWNAAHGTFGWEGVADALAANDPTLAVLIESGDEPEEGEASASVGGTAAFWRGRFPDHFLARPGAGLTVLSRGPLGRSELVELTGGGTAAVVRAKLSGERVFVVAVDLPATPTADRGAPLRELAELVEGLAEGRPVILAGDFNTPPDSVHFAPLRRAGFHQAFERHGSGYAATWPVPAPALHLDHVWLSAGFDVGEAWHGWTAHSDHRPVLVPARVVPAKFAASLTPDEDAT